MVHWDRERYRRRLFKQIFTLLVVVVLFSFFYNERNGFAGKEAPFTIVDRFEVPMKEISGAVMLPVPGGHSLALVSDRKAEIMLFNLESGHTEIRSFKDLLVERFSLCRTEDFEECKKFIKKLSSNWEALRRDGQGRYFTLQEHTQSVVVLNQDVTRIEKVLHFNFAEAFPDLISRGTKKFQTNSLGEGLILLKNGHFLVAKEQYPIALVEFGPEGSSALGLNAESLLGPDAAFELPENADLHSNYKPLATWLVSAHSKCDISDLDVDAKGRLVVLSQTCRGVAIVDQLIPGHKLPEAEYLLLPEEISKPESLIIDGDRWLVASDIPSKRKYNFYILRR